MKRARIKLIMLSLATWGGAAAAAEPIGFERWNPLPSSYVTFNRTCGDLQQEFNHPGGFSTESSSTQHTPGAVQTTAEDDVDRSKRFRLSDIEVRFDQAAGENVLDAVVVTNTGSFQRPSWLACGLSQAEVFQWSKVKGVTLLDIERYHNSHGFVWAAIIQADPFDVPTHFIPAATIDSINWLADFYGARVLDIDKVGFVEGGCAASKGGACAPEAEFSAILVGNSGQNFIDWHLDEANVGSSPIVPDNFQLVDREQVQTPFDWVEARLSVAKDKEWHPLNPLSQADVNFYNHSSYGIVVDLEWEDVDGAIGAYEWYIVTVRQW